ncbi:hypothetical protein J3A64_001772 [Pseudarthrobacter sp. PvP004]|nr:hypothetical protein [Pseudarthrobacter sp. PvP004]
MGANVELRQQGRPVCNGYVDDVNKDGAILWLLTPDHGRKLYEKAEFFEAWATKEALGFHYRVSLAESVARPHF